MSDRTVPDLIDGEKPECDCCGYPAALKYYNPPVLTHRPGVPPDQQEMMLCEICASTFLSHCIEYQHYRDQHSLFSSIGWIANRIL